MHNFYECIYLEGLKLNKKNYLQPARTRDICLEVYRPTLELESRKFLKQLGTSHIGNTPTSGQVGLEMAHNLFPKLCKPGYYVVNN